MRHLLSIFLMFGTVGLLAIAPLPGGKGQALQKEVAFVEFPQQVRLLGVFLKGSYLIVHDDSRMAQGGDCLYVYKRENGKPDKLVESYHCTPVARKKADQFTVRMARVSNLVETREIREIQFAGSSEAHQVPTE